MADITKPILLDETGQEIVTALETIAENMGTSAGHTIQNDSGSDMQRRDKLQFKGVYVEDDQTNDVTKVNICRTMTKAQMEVLSGEALKGFINTSDEPDNLPLTAEWVAYGNGSVKDGIESAQNTADLALSKTYSITTIPGENISKTITFSGKTYTRRFSVLLVLAGQSAISAPIAIGFGGNSGYNSIVSVFTSNSSIAVSGLSITLPTYGGNWGEHTIIKLYPNDELTWTIS